MRNSHAACGARPAAGAIRGHLRRAACRAWWLGWRVLQQDRALETQRLRERLDSAATLLAGELNRGFSQWEDLLTRPDGSNRIVLPSGSVFLLIGPDGVVQQQGVPLAYYPHLPGTSTSYIAVFAAAEALEFRAQNLPQAVAAYRRLASSPDRSIRANALMRLARGLRKQQRVHEALAAYEEMAALGDAVVAGSPAELVARRERAVLLDSIHDAGAAASERLYSRAPLWRDTSASTVRHLISSSLRLVFGIAPKEALSGPFRAAQAVEALQALWQEQAAGRAAWTGDAASFATVWRRTPRRHGKHHGAPGSADAWRARGHAEPARGRGAGRPRRPPRLGSGFRWSERHEVGK